MNAPFGTLHSQHLKDATAVHRKLLVVSSVMERELLLGMFVQSFRHLTLTQQHDFLAQDDLGPIAREPHGGHLRLGLKLMGQHAWQLARRPVAADLPAIAKSATLILCRRPASPDLNRLALILLAQANGFKLVPETPSANIIAAMSGRSILHLG